MILSKAKGCAKKILNIFPFLFAAHVLFFVTTAHMS
jgi:hypothetical protein